MTNEQVLLGLLGIVVTVAIAIISFQHGKRTNGRNGNGADNSSGGKPTEFWLLEFQKVNLAMSASFNSLLERLPAAIATALGDRDRNLLERVKETIREVMEESSDRRS